MTVVPTLVSADAESSPELHRLRNVVLASIVIYFVVQIILRLALSDSLLLDEAEQVLLAQKLRLGNGTQPPLYTWVQAGFFAVFGTNLFALSLFKNLQLMGGFLLMYACVRRITRSELAGLQASLSVMLMPHISWEAQRDLSHSVLLFLTTLLNVWAFIRLAEARTPVWYIALGVSVGIGVLSKYNYALFFAAFLAAALTVREFRRVVLDWRFGLAIAVCALVIWPHLHWMLHHPEETLSKRTDFEGQKNTVLEGLWQLAVGVLTYVALILIFYGAFFWRTLCTTAPPATLKPYLSLFRRTLLLGLALSAVGIVALHVTQIEGRWLLPLMVLVPAWLAVRVRDELVPRSIRGTYAFAAVMVGVVITSMVLRVVVPTLGGARKPLNVPYAELAGKVDAAGFHGGTIIASDKLIGGNFAVHFEGSRTLVAGLTMLDVPPTGDCLVVWDPAGRRDYNAAAWQLAEAYLGPRQNWPATQHVEAPLKRGGGDAMRLAFVHIARPAVAEATAPR